MLPALLTLSLLGAHGPLPFSADDYPKALAQAKAAHKPLFVDAWAPW